MNEIERQLETEKTWETRERNWREKTTILTKVGTDTEKPYNRQRKNPKNKQINKQTKNKTKNKQTNKHLALPHDFIFG